MDDIKFIEGRKRICEAQAGCRTVRLFVVELHVYLVLTPVLHLLIMLNWFSIVILNIRQRHAKVCFWNNTRKLYWTLMAC